MIAYTCGAFDILRAKDLQELDRQIQLSKQEGSEFFGVGIYDNNLCENLGFNTPLKSLEDRMNIMKYIRGVDFVFPVSSLHEDILKDNVKKHCQLYLANKNSQEKNASSKKEYKLGYAPGTYDLFHAGHLENLTIASSQCEKLVVGVKSDELVEEHKHRKPVMPAEERMEILRHFKFVHDAYIYYTRDLHIANDWFKSKYNQSIDAVFLGSDLENDFSNVTDIKIVFTPRNKETMKTRSTTAYRKLHLGRIEGGFTTGPHPSVSPLKLASENMEAPKKDEHDDLEH